MSSVGQTTAEWIMNNFPGATIKVIKHEYQEYYLAHVEGEPEGHLRLLDKNDLEFLQKRGHPVTLPEKVLIPSLLPPH